MLIPFFKYWHDGRKVNASLVRSWHNPGDFIESLTLGLFIVIDLVRLLLFFAPLPAGAPPNASSLILEALLEASNWNNLPKVSEEQPMSKSWETNVLLVLRAFANCLQVWTDGTTYGANDWISSVGHVTPSALR